MWNKLKFKHYAAIFLLMVISFETTAIAVDRIRSQISDLAFSVEANFKNNYFVEKFKNAELRCSVLPPRVSFNSIKGLKRDVIINPIDKKDENGNISNNKELVKMSKNHHENLTINNKVQPFEIADAQKVLDYIEHKIISGDTISKIAKVYGVKIDELKTLNNITDEKSIKVGTVIKVPIRAQKFVYTVKEGDSLAKLANKFRVSMQDLIEANNLKSYKLQENQKLVIPVPASKYNLVKINSFDNFELETKQDYKKNNMVAYNQKITSTQNSNPSNLSEDKQKELTAKAIKSYKITQNQDESSSKNNNLIKKDVVSNIKDKNPNLQQFNAIVDATSNSKLSMKSENSNIVDKCIRYNNLHNSNRITNFMMKESKLNNVGYERFEELKSFQKVYKVDKVSTRLRISSNFFYMPVKSFSLTDKYGWRYHPIYRRRLFHAGIDLSAPKGTPIYASAAGQVVYAGWRPGYGKLIIIKHPNGLSTRYGHCSHIRVKVGQIVRAGEQIGNVGQTGTATGPHLHFEVRRNGKTLNPLYFLRDLRHYLH